MNVQLGSAAADEVLGNVTAAMQAKGLWPTTLLSGQSAIRTRAPSAGRVLLDLDNKALIS